MWRRAAVLLLFLVPAVIASMGAYGGEKPSGADIYLFWTRGCPHCESAMAFLGRLQAEYPLIRMHPLEISEDASNRDLLLKYAEVHNVDDLRVPVIVVGNRVIAGYHDDATTGAELKAAALACLETEGGCRDEVMPLLTGTDRSTGEEEQPRASPPPQRSSPLPETLRLPILGEVSTRHLSLPMLTILLGAADGFNPCAMWTLVFLMGLLVGMRDRLRRWILGATFVAASAFVYYLIMAAWLNMLLLIGMVIWIRWAIGAIAIGAGGWALREFVVNPEAVCKVTSSERRSRVLTRLRSLASEPHFSAALAGIVLLAFAVNVVELFCSAGIPAVYTQVLALSAMPRWQYHAYLALYILVFMLDDLVVFVTAMVTLELTGLTGRYTRWANLVSGIVLIVIGALMILKPEWLMFG